MASDVPAVSQRRAAPGTDRAGVARPGRVRYPDRGTGAQPQHLLQHPRHAATGRLDRQPRRPRGWSLGPRLLAIARHVRLTGRRRPAGAGRPQPPARLHRLRGAAARPGRVHRHRQGRTRPGRAHHRRRRRDLPVLGAGHHALVPRLVRPCRGPADRPVPGAGVHAGDGHRPGRAARGARAPASAATGSACASTTWASPACPRRCSTPAAGSPWWCARWRSPPSSTSPRSTATGEQVRECGLRISARTGGVGRLLTRPPLRHPPLAVGFSLTLRAHRVTSH